MHIDYTSLHTATFYLMYVCLALAIFVCVERLVYYVQTQRHARELEVAVTGHAGELHLLPKSLIERDSLPAQALRTMMADMKQARSAEDIQHLSSAVFLSTKSRMQKNLWILDTIVTAAPLLGLLGTILGIIETFTTLAEHGISDPKGVSAGIGTALLATAMGITVALIGLVFLNHFHDRVDRISEHLKVLLLRSAVRHEVA
ncbi:MULTISPECIES: MotA/TolQ/ExbB proton channel family protein [unclassified Paludibacterium]|uniref:MotA/TolQ/ExbB proton channel family protein n=1 Tax=unclassified Paludibacterium TaxID=2618429 RepID=UPI001C0473B5|nr:MotA/TolQ/ExbB proton channel family protein [Paludibacterium sp. B53371]BEV71444.1 MotA/TolQ/ExbB proton channel family protein [Paludibacterium sp. THUN1379]